MYPKERQGGEDIMFEKIRATIASQLSIDEEEIKMESSFMDNLGADSLDIVELIMALEEKYDIEIPDEDVEKIVTVGDVVEYIKARSEG
jgi:acyl carrier protein